MKTASMAEANRQFSKLVRDVVADGEEVTITSRGKPVAKIVPIDDAAAQREWEEAKRELFERLAKQPALNLGPFSRDDAYEDGYP